MIVLRFLLCLVGLVNDYIKDFQKEKKIWWNGNTKGTSSSFCWIYFQPSRSNFYNGSKFKDYIKLYKNLALLLQKSVDQLLVDSYKKNDQEFRGHFLNKHSEFRTWLE